MKGIRKLSNREAAYRMRKRVNENENEREKKKKNKLKTYASNCYLVSFGSSNIAGIKNMLETKIEENFGFILIQFSDARFLKQNKNNITYSRWPLLHLNQSLILRYHTFNCFLFEFQIH